MPAAPSPSKQSRTHQPAVLLPPCRELIEQVDAHMLKQRAFAQQARRNVMMTTGPPPPPILPLAQRAPGQAPYTRSHQTKPLPPLLPRNVMVPPPPPFNPTRSMHGPYPATMGRPVATCRPATHEVTLPPTAVNPHPDLRMFIVSPENYYSLMQSSSSTMRSASTPGQVLDPALPPAISHSKRTNNNAERVDRKTTGNGKAVVKARRVVAVHRGEGAK